MSNLSKLLSWYESLTPSSLESIDQIYAENAFFKDPFNQVEGTHEIKKIFKAMFESLEDAHFVFVNKISEDSQSFVTWDFIFNLRGKKYKIHGSSFLRFDTDGRVVYHRDYWDVGEELLLKIPVIKSIYGAFRNKVASH